jgi:hypothetical protein
LCFQSLVYTMGDRDTYLANAVNQLEQVPPQYLAPIESSSSYVSARYKYNQSSPMAFKPPRDNGQTRLFLGMNGEIGLASSCIREDDVLCQFPGCDIAAIVRPKGDKYQIISRAVVAKRHPLLSSTMFRIRTQARNCFFMLMGMFFRHLLAR